MNVPRHSLRQRIVWTFALFALLASLCFSAFSLIFVYVVEDSFFDNMLRQELDHQRAGLLADGATRAPLRSFVSVHHSPASFPADLAQQFGANASQREFAGEQGRHYHVLRPTADVPVYLVAEVSRELVVRPRIPFIASVLGALVLGMLLLTALGGYLLARSATAPLARLAQLVSDADPQRLPRRFAHQFPGNEIGIVARGLEQALDRTADFIEREQRFTQDASHELRTPVAVIDGAARLLAAQPLQPKAADQVQRIAAAANSMGQILTTLLALAREELDREPTHPVELLPLVEEIVVRHVYLLDGKAVQVQVQIGARAVTRCHKAALEILLSNLISNAFNHSQAGVVHISLTDAVLEVVDTGPGIDAELQGRMFEAGAKGQHSLGLGLGLSIARRLAERTGFTLAIASAPGAGTRAVLGLPQVERFQSPSAA